MKFNSLSVFESATGFGYISCLFRWINTDQKHLYFSVYFFHSLSLDMKSHYPSSSYPVNSRNKLYTYIKSCVRNYICSLDMLLIWNDVLQQFSSVYSIDNDFVMLRGERKQIDENILQSQYSGLNFILYLYIYKYIYNLVYNSMIQNCGEQLMEAIANDSEC